MRKSVKIRVTERGHVYGTSGPCHCSHSSSRNYFNFNPVPPSISDSTQHPPYLDTPTTFHSPLNPLHSSTVYSSLTPLLLPSLKSPSTIHHIHSSHGHPSHYTALLYYLTLPSAVHLSHPPPPPLTLPNTRSYPCPPTHTLSLPLPLHSTPPKRTREMGRGWSNICRGP